MMERKFAIFAKKQTSNTEGGKPKIFYRYLTTLTRKSTGEPVTVQVKFREECGEPKGDKCPMNIVVPENGANMAERRYKVPVTDPDTGEKVYDEIRVVPVLWIGAWAEGEPYRDTSLDDYE